MKISVKLEVSVNQKHHKLDLDDLNLTQSEWDKMSEFEKFKAVESAVFDLHEQPYWTLSSFTEE